MSIEKSIDQNIQKKEYANPEFVAHDTTKGKKEHYAEIVVQYKGWQQQVKSKEDREEFLVSLVDSLSVMNQEIYEHFRALRDLLTEEVKKQIRETSSVALSYVILKACNEGFLLKERYYPIGMQMLTKMEAEGTFDSCSEIYSKACEAFMQAKESDEADKGARQAAYLKHTKEKQEALANGQTGMVNVMITTARSVTFSIGDQGIYNTKETYRIFVNNVFVKETNTVINSVYELYPQTKYEITVQNQNQEQIGWACITTAYESATVNVKEFGAAGDGIQDDTKYIQAAILSCPKQGRVWIPRGCYRITSLYLRSDIAIEISEGAELKADNKREDFVHYPATLFSTDETDEIHLGTWEGNPLPMFAGIISGFEVENVLIYGEGTVNGNASKQDWWDNPKVMRTAFRPRLFFINHCKNITLQGVKFCNSPSWTLHPFFSDNLKFYNVIIENPSDSPNTDGLDPESCDNIEIAGVRFSLGDDCIAVKSGKIYMGRKYKKPSENIHIHQCLMENGHGAVTIGSEMAGGVNHLLVENCKFSHTDRGLRIKTRRGRGEDAILDEIVFKNIDMDHVMTPFVVNSFYFCDPDGHSSYVQSREKMPVDARTPKIKRLVFSQISAKNCHVAAAHLEGLPEQKIEELVLEDIVVTYANDAKCDVPAMSEGVEPCSRKGIYANYVNKLKLKNICITGQVGEPFILCNVDEADVR